MSNITWPRKHNLEFYVEIPTVKINTEFGSV